MSSNLELSLVLKLKDQIGGGLQRLNREIQFVGSTGRTAMDSLMSSTKRLDSVTQQTERSTQALLKNVRQLSTERGPSGLVNGLRTAHELASKTFSVLQKIGTAQAAVAAAGYVGARAVNPQMDYGLRLANMANTAFSDRTTAGRIAGKQELNAAITGAVRSGGGSRDSVAETLDTLIASGAMPVKDAMAMLPGLSRSATAANADPNQLAQIAIRGMQTFKIGSGDLGKTLDMALVAGQEGGFELKDMARWLPQQMAAARMSGLSGTQGMAKLLAANQASAITAGSKDEAGNNLVNLLAKINSQDTAKDAQKLGINLSGLLAAARGKGVDSLDAFVNLTEQIVGKDKNYQTLRANAATATGDDRRANLEAQADILQGSSIGKIIQDRQALMALIGVTNNRDYMKSVEGKVLNAQGASDKNFSVIESESSFKNQQRKNETEIASYTGFERLAPILNGVNDGLVSMAKEYPSLTSAIIAATAGLTALAAAAGVSSLLSLVKGGAAAGEIGAVAASGGGVLSALKGGGGKLLSKLGVTAAFAGGMPLTSFAGAAPLSALTGVGAAGAVGYGVGSLIHKGIEGTAFEDAIGRAIAKAMAGLGNKEAQRAIKVEVDVKNGNIVASANEQANETARWERLRR